MKTFDRILFVSGDGTCRAPMAASAMRHYVDGTRIHIGTRGMVVLFPEPFDDRAGQMAEQAGVKWKQGYSRQIAEDDFSDTTLVLTMDSLMKATLYKEFKNAVNVFTMGEFAGETDVQVKNPAGRGSEALESCFMQLQVLAAIIKGKPELQASEREGK